MTTQYMGDSIEDFQVLDLLGKGGFACVYRGRCLATGQEVAIKMIDKKAMRTAGMVNRVCNEVEIHCRLKHPSILELYTYFEDDNYVYLVLELAENGEANRYLRKQGHTLKESEVRRIMLQVVKGVLYLHSHGIIHRDLSLGNILLSSDMDAKIADFGLATRLSLPDEKHYTMCGTPNYISPEIATRDPHGLESDVWSIGCMLFTLLVGKPPFDTEAVRSTLNKVVLAEYDIPNHVSIEARDLISKLLKKNPQDRLTLSGILDHPFITNQTLNTKYSSPTRQHLNPRAYENSLDSGTGTMATISTGHAPFQQDNRHAVKSSSAERTSDIWPRDPKHPPSPPVRQRPSSCPSTENVTTGSSSHVRGSDVAQPAQYSGLKTRTSDSWLSDIHSSKIPKLPQKPLVGLDKMNGIQSKFKSYNATKYSSYYGSTLGDILHLAGQQNGTNTSSSGFYSADTKSYSANHGLKTSSTDHNNKESCQTRDNHMYEKSIEQPSATKSEHSRAYSSQDSRPHSHHKRHGSDSVSKDFDASPQPSQGESRRRQNHRSDSERQTRRAEKSRSGGRDKSLGELTEPLNAERLRPIRQKTRNAVVSITDEAEVCLEFLQQKGGQSIVTEVIRIASNGMKISVYQPSEAEKVLGSEPPLPPSAGNGSYLFPSLPSKYWKKYKYAAKFVQLVRKLTPKVTLYSKHAKCVLMENYPHADFEVCFYNGAKVHQSQECTRIIEPGGVSYTLESVGGIEGVPVEMRKLIQHVKAAYQQCVRLERIIMQEEKESNGNQYFPFIVGRRPPAWKNSSGKSEKQDQQGCSNGQSQPVLPSSPSIAAPAMTSLLSFDGTIASTAQTTNPAFPGKSRKTSPSKTSRHKQSPAQPIPAEVANAKTDPSPHHYVEGSSPIPSAHVCKMAFVDGVGWSSQLTTGEVWIQYTDGSQIIFHAAAAAIKFTDSTGNVTRYGYADRLPSVIKEKLSHLPAVIKTLATTSKVS
ncbi:predicted protein [Nematostella vectensis]|uniref:Serine/threonine-protein kinase PLK4 n=1 Tax=Nematostella vectensis TaxID=45351 RepID=PLK4_NEMVE|nr:RecName: Full=Serine/threonine-protein kinase PLK4; AltName: Full=Polo-like kinase 4; Short=PLK-4 [Nematostella vectensis]EDO34707.1 predicted protein [Nematostella vectensis]|eukprot:XP_001626807.1 predicted protein [Nematostella vectensis]